MPNLLSLSTPQTEFAQSIPAQVSDPLRPFIVGPHAQLFRYAVAAEKALIALGAYDPNANHIIDYPNLPGSSIVDQTYVQLYMDNALLQYYQKVDGQGEAVAPVAGYNNRIRIAGSNGFKADGASYPRITTLYDRDVAVGDIVNLNDGENDFNTSVAGFVADVVAAVVGSATSAGTNAIAQPISTAPSAPSVNVTGGGSSGGSLAAGVYFVRYAYDNTAQTTPTWASASATFTVSAGDIPTVTVSALPSGAAKVHIYLSPVGGTAAQCTLYTTGTGTTYNLAAAYAAGGAPAVLYGTQTAGASNDVNLSAAAAVGYDGTSTGQISEVYTVLVTQGSTSGDATTAIFQVTSASGRDNQASVTPAAFGSATGIGSRGLTATWSHSSNDFVTGQTWQIPVNQLWLVPAPTAGGTYSGTVTGNYIATVTRGGLYTDSAKPQISITTDTGFDSSGPATVTAASSAVAAGSLGATIEFSANGLNYGDVYVIPVTAPGSGAYRTLVLNNNIPSAMLSDDDMTLTLSIQENGVAIPAARLSAPPAMNWTTSSSAITINSGMTAYNATLTNDGVAFAVPVASGSMFVQYRAWLSTYAMKMTALATPADVSSLFGATQLVPDNPLGYAMWLAAQASGGETVYFAAIASPADYDDWTNTLLILVNLDYITELVPLSTDPNVWTIFQNHIVARSESAAVDGEWRHAWFGLQITDSVGIVTPATTTDENPALGTLAANPDAVGTQYTVLTCTSSNAQFITNGVEPGDVVRYLYTFDAFGNPSYSEFIVDTVVNQDELILLAGPNSPIGTPQQFQVWRNLTSGQVAANLADFLGQTANMDPHFRFLAPDTMVDVNGVASPSYNACVVYAVLCGSIAPQQGFGNVAIPYITDVPNSYKFFNNADLNTLGAAGAFVLTLDQVSGSVYAVFPYTPAVSTVETLAEATTRLDDAIRYLFYTQVTQFFQSYNVGPALYAQIDAEFKSTINYGISSTIVQRLGPMFTSATSTLPQTSPTIPNVAEVTVTVQRPLPLASLELTASF